MMSLRYPEFSYRTRADSLERFRASRSAEKRFDLLVIGGGITGAGVARDAASRGLKVALVEKNDFAFGTSSRSSKLIHGGLRYLENLEFSLVFEALAERALLLKTAPHMVRPLPFLLPVYEKRSKPKWLYAAGLWLYDLLTLFRTPGWHRDLTREAMLREVPFLSAEGLVGGFRYFDASMWDDVLAVETLRAAQSAGATVANYVEAVRPIWNAPPENGGIVRGFVVRDREQGEEIDLLASRVVVCGGPWTDDLGLRITPEWRRWLNPSKGVHLLFDLKKIPVTGALVMTNPEDGRIAFVIPRPDFGPGVVIVGTTDGPTPEKPEQATIDPADVGYLLGLLKVYFPGLDLKVSDILSGYVGVRPLFGNQVADATGTVAGEEAAHAPHGAVTMLQKVSREHHIASGPGGTVVVAGGKYTTHRKMAEEIVDYALNAWRDDVRSGRDRVYPMRARPPATHSPVNPAASPAAIAEGRGEAARRGWKVPEELWSRYGAGALEVYSIHQELSGHGRRFDDPEGFPMLEAQLRFSIRHEMTERLEDFYLRRVPLYLARADHGLPWAESLARAWAEERGLTQAHAVAERERLVAEIEKRSAWQKRLGSLS